MCYCQILKNTWCVHPCTPSTLFWELKVIKVLALGYTWNTICLIGCWWKQLKLYWEFDTFRLLSSMTNFSPQHIVSMDQAIFTEMFIILGSWSKNMVLHNRTCKFILAKFIQYHNTDQWCLMTHDQVTYPMLSKFVLTFWEFFWFFTASKRAPRCLLVCLLFVNKHVSDLLFKDVQLRNFLGIILLIKAMTLEEIFVKKCAESATKSLNSFPTCFKTHTIPKSKQNEKSKRGKKMKRKGGRSESVFLFEGSRRTKRCWYRHPVWEAQISVNKQTDNAASCFVSFWQKWRSLRILTALSLRGT